MLKKLAPSSLSIFAFGCYMLIEGILLVTFPDFLLELLQIPSPGNIWVRISGFALFVLGFYYLVAALNNLRPFYIWTVFIRSLQLVFFLVLVGMGEIGWPILLNAGTEFAAGMWTLLALRMENQAA
jgi:hypothetical protein